MLENVGANILCKVKAPVAPAGRFTKDDFRIDLELGTVVCPAGEPPGCARSRAGRSPASAAPASHARCLRSAPPDRPGGRSAWARTSSTSLADANAKPIRCGRPTTQRPAEDRAEDRSSDATPTRRTPCPCPRSHKGERRLQSPRSCSQPRARRNPRCHQPQRADRRDRLRRSPARKPGSKRHSPCHTATNASSHRARHGADHQPLRRSYPTTCRPRTARSARNGRFTPAS